MIKRKHFLAAFLAIAAMTMLQAAVNSSVTSGEWKASSTWSLHRAPQSNDTIIISSAQTVTINGHIDPLQRVFIQVYGTLEVKQGKKLRLDIQSGIQVYPGGVITGVNCGSKIEIAQWIWEGCDGNDVIGPAYATGGMSNFVSGVLPVQLIQFSAEKQDDIVLLKWATLSELNNDVFTVERSLDAVTFYSVSCVQGAGNSSVRKDYSTTDDAPVNGMAYYRLKQTDKDGKTTILRTISFNILTAENAYCSFYIYPNPCEKYTLVQMNNCSVDATEINGKFKLHDMSGKEVRTEMEEQGKNLYRMNTAPLAVGVYLLTFGEGAAKVTKRLVVK